MSLERYLADRRVDIDRELGQRLARSLEGVEGRLAAAIRHAVLAGGKRLRPILTLAAAEATGGGPWPSAMGFGCAVELVHAYSLVHDDLPSMDDDDLRRGQPTCHKVYGEALAILAGDALLTEAFAWTASLPSPLGGDLCRELARAAGALGMVGGQALDVTATGPGDVASIEQIHLGKTGALLSACAAGGGLCAGASPEAISSLRRFGERLGLAFQASDDVLDVTGDPEARGKRRGGDAAQGKATLVGALGLEGAQRRALEHAEAAAAELGGLFESSTLRELALYAATRTR
ncbi:MAG: polyprenyl synthetase family protein [Deltaproteobacteria bacterium]